MCDYSLHSIKTRDAKVGDRLWVTHFGTGTRGFARVGDCGTATCLKPGTEVVFDLPIGSYDEASVALKCAQHCTARFRQVNLERPHAHHDALELPDGTVLKLTLLREGQHATVLQLPAKPARGQQGEDRRLLFFEGRRVERAEVRS